MILYILIKILKLSWDDNFPKSSQIIQDFLSFSVGFGVKAQASCKIQKSSTFEPHPLHKGRISFSLFVALLRKYIRTFKSLESTNDNLVWPFTCRMLWNVFGFEDCKILLELKCKMKRKEFRAFHLRNYLIYPRSNRELEFICSKG